MGPSDHSAATNHKLKSSIQSVRKETFQTFVAFFGRLLCYDAREGPIKNLIVLQRPTHGFL